VTVDIEGRPRPQGRAPDIGAHEAGGPAPPPGPGPTPAGGEQCFSETGTCVRGRFLDHWRAHGGLAVNGYPISEEFVETLEDGNAYTVQYFERARFEHHPEFAGTAYEVLLGHLGREQYQARFAAAPGPDGQGSPCFPQTGWCIDPLFAGAWARYGGLDQLGLPLSGRIREVSPTDGRTYELQYFERARLEHHPDHSPPHDVLLGLVGREQYHSRYPGAAIPGTRAGDAAHSLDVACGWRMPAPRLPRGGDAGAILRRRAA
jgi:hypothetical protein